MTYEEFKARQQDVLIRNRSHNEIILNQWMEYYNTLPQSVKDKFPIPADLTYQKACPEAYKQNPDQEVYNREQEALDKMFEPINQFAAENNKKVDELLKQAEAELTK